MQISRSWLYASVMPLAFWNPWSPTWDPDIFLKWGVFFFHKSKFSFRNKTDLMLYKKIRLFYDHSRVNYASWNTHKNYILSSILQFLFKWYTTAHKYNTNEVHRKKYASWITMRIDIKIKTMLFLDVTVNLKIKWKIKCLISWPCSSRICMIFSTFDSIRMKCDFSWTNFITS